MAHKKALWFIFLLLTAANIYIYFHRNDGYEYVKQAAYAELYPNISKGISNISIEKDSEAVITLKGFHQEKWNVYCDSNLVAANISSPLHFTLKEKLNRYFIAPADSLMQPIIMDADYSPAFLYKAKSSSIGTNYEIRYCSVPFINNDSESVYKWKDDLSYMNPDELTAVKKIIQDSLKILPRDSTEIKIKKIGSYIFGAIKNNMGIPADTISNYSPYQQFCAAKNGQANIWCGNITDIFHLFASSTGIVCRKVGLSGSRHPFHFGDHSLNECYVPETGKWVYVDITQNILLLKDSLGNYLNTVDLYHLKKLNQTGCIVQVSAGDSAFLSGGYNNPNTKYLWSENEILFPLPHNPKTLYSFSNRFQRYAGIHPWLMYYNENYQYNNARFYLKSFLLHAWLLLGAIILVLYLLTKKKKLD